MYNLGKTSPKSYICKSGKDVVAIFMLRKGTPYLCNEVCKALAKKWLSSVKIWEISEIDSGNRYASISEDPIFILPLRTHLFES